MENAPSVSIPSTPFLTTEQAAERILLRPTTLNRLRVEGHGPPFLRISARRIVYDVNALDAWVRSKSFNSTSEYPSAN